MSGFDLSPRPDACLSDLKLDRLIVGELRGGADRDGALAHLAICPRCQRRRADIEAQPALLPDQALRRKAAPRRRGTLVAAISVLAVAAAVLLLARPQQDGARDQAGTRLKGGDFGFEVLVRWKGDGRVGSVLPDAPLHPGDVIGFRVRSPAGGHLAIVSVDGAGGVSSYLPGAAGPIARVPPGEQMVEGAVRLDAVAGRETVLAALCAAESDAARALTAAKAALAKAGPGGELPRLELPCAQARATLVKEAVP